MSDVPDCRNIQRVYDMIWQAGETEIVPIHVLTTVANNGGVLLGAYAHDGPVETGGMVGFVFGWLGTTVPKEGVPAQVKHCSHIAGVLPAWQRRGVGLLLKLAQREAVLEQGVTEHITWTYDPLLRRNAVFNLRRLGAISTTYKRNIYGEMHDALNAGLPTDRCQVDWFLRNPRVERAAAGQVEVPDWDAMPLERLPTELHDAIRIPAEARPTLDGRPLAVPLPDDLDELRRHDLALPIAWRFYLREIFEHAFAGGYALVDCCRLSRGGWYYLLRPASEV